MAALTLKGIPDHTLARLRELAASQRRSLNQQAIYVLERAAREQDGFASAYSSFLERRADLPADGPEEYHVERVADSGREPVNFD